MELIRLKSSKITNKMPLLPVVFEALKREKVKLGDGDIIIISSKVVALSQGRVIKLSEVVPSAKAKKMKLSRYGTGKEDPRMVELVLRESQKVIPGNMLLSLKDGILIPAAGIDLSNMPGDMVALWPEDVWNEARRIQHAVKKEFGLKKFGVAIIDSHCQPLRWGTTGVALAWAGFEGIEDERGKKDLYGKKLTVTRKAVADNLASAAQLVMGEAAEQTPFVIVRDAPVKFTSRKIHPNEATVSPEQCVFSGLYKNMLR